MSLSYEFKIERQKINNQIKDERVIAHCHTIINKIEEDVKKGIKQMKKENSYKKFKEIQNILKKLEKKYKDWKFTAEFGLKEEEELSE